ncbi:Uncharacterised protein [Enterobacter cloacae]|nr:Uncharacterised protein [Enterobacter cloacae]
MTFHCALRDIFKQCFSRTLAAVFRGDIQIFHIDAVATKPGGIAGEKNGIPHSMACIFGNQRFGFTVCTKQRFTDFVRRGDHFFWRFFIDCEFVNHIVYCRCIFRSRLTNRNAHSFPFIFVCS